VIIFTSTRNRNNDAFLVDSLAGMTKWVAPAR